MMQSKRLIYVSLTILLLGSSFVSGSAQVMAAESATSASVQSSTPTTDAASPTEQPQSVIEDRTGETNPASAVQSTSAKVQAKSSIDNPPSDIDKPTSNGWSFLLTIFNKGFSRQPQEEDYIAKKDIGSASISGMSILTAYTMGIIIPNEDINVRRWHWDASQGNWIEDKYRPGVKTYSNPLDLVDAAWRKFGFYDVNPYSLSDLDVGTYYYQFGFKYGTDGIISKAPRFYSQLAKVVVTPEPIPATAINSNTDNTDGTPKVMYSDISYDANAIVTPFNSTDNINWQPSSKSDELKFSPGTGRKIAIKAGNGNVNDSQQYVPDSYYTSKVNTDPNTPGIPAKYKIAAGNVAKDKTVYVGGLPAYKKAMDLGGTWSVGGLADLATATGSTGSWHYEWKITDSTGKTLTPSADSGVSNLKGDITNLSNLNTEQPLTFTKDSSFIKDAATATAAGKSYQAQLTLTTTVNTNNETIVSNKAELQAQPAVGKLSLDQVPSFKFGNVLSKDIYIGTTAQGKQYQVSDGLKITDTRATPGWKLTAKMSKMASTTGKQLSSTAINMTGLPTNVGLSDNGTETPIMTDKISKTWQVAGKLALSANPNIQLASGDTFSSNITWTLNSAQPAAPAA